METIIELTKTELIEVFKEWNTELMENPNNFKNIGKGTEFKQAEDFITRLMMIKEKNNN